MFAGRHNHFADCHKSQAVTPGSDPSVNFLWHEEKDDAGTIDLCREPPFFSPWLFLHAPGNIFYFEHLTFPVSPFFCKPIDLIILTEPKQVLILNFLLPSFYFQVLWGDPCKINTCYCSIKGYTLRRNSSI